jgi:transcriptional regulator with PAS, ATPase and Fis domain
MRAVLERARAFTQKPGPLTLVGPTGVGKDLLAQHIHGMSPESAGPFAVSSGAELRGDLVESHLFGHVKGAFTGAISDRAGLLGRGAGGTILLDELDQMPLHVQGLLLRVLQERRWKVVGSDVERVFNARLILAVHRHPDELVAERILLPDLRFRMGERILTIPPLGERAAEIPSLVTQFLDQERAAFANGRPGPVVGISPGALAMLVTWSWPGNVRELEKVIEHAYLIAVHRGADRIEVADFPDRFHHPLPRLTPEQRQLVIRWFMGPGRSLRVTRQELADGLLVSPGTVDNDRKACLATSEGSAMPKPPAASQFPDARPTVSALQTGL